MMTKGFGELEGMFGIVVDFENDHVEFRGDLGGKIFRLGIDPVDVEASDALADG